MSILIDTNIAIALIRDRPAAVRSHYRRAAASGDDVYLSSISLFELWYGVSRSRDVTDNTERLADFLYGPIHIAEFDELDAARAGLIRAELGAVGTPIGPYDVLIAGQAARNEYTLITGSSREFARVAGLTVDDWTKEPR
ncbi:type II toxin-antitoxin system VapC family toxin [Phytoactinopolyspora alkaliphila]|uniref:Ribonuclease VapC n=1 Tax=Phytoactinopolyspora alkaliphila TaxID=1783498 RepID=A0A6N9YKS7_9ACTN|nr:PIN domain-containing protein [Phytoactinopolyspora alkaliphila]NED95545.1 type II toxin-antitoxin system VapC family toxin [Phytoactinopolyspora alkaliphila]